MLPPELDPLPPLLPAAAPGVFDAARPAHRCSQISLPCTYVLSASGPLPTADSKTCKSPCMRRRHGPCQLAGRRRQWCTLNLHAVSGHSTPNICGVLHAPGAGLWPQNGLWLAATGAGRAAPRRGVGSRSAPSPGRPAVPGGISSRGAGQRPYSKGVGSTDKVGANRRRVDEAPTPPLSAVCLPPLPASP